MAAPSGEFEMARRVAVRMMETRAFAKDVEEEDPTMVKYIPPLRCLNELGMITFDSQSGRRFTFPKIIKMSERVEGASRGDKAIYTVLEEFGQLGVVQRECEGSVSWPAQASPVVMSHDYTSHYGRWIYPEKRGKPPDADGEVAIMHVGPYMEHPIPAVGGVSSVCGHATRPPGRRAGRAVHAARGGAPRGAKGPKGPKAQSEHEGPR